MEEWRDIQGWEGLYAVSNHGRIKSLPKCRMFNDKQVCKPETFMTLQKCPNGYLQVHLRRVGVRVKLYVHRGVAVAFIPNPKNCLIVDHNDRDRTNNRADNLEWVTSSENNYYRVKRAREEVAAATSDMAF